MTHARSLAWWAGLGCLVLASRTSADTEGLLGHWKFDEGQGDVVVDSSGNENDGDVWGAEWVRGAFGTALRFDGQGAYVAIPEIAGLDGSNELTVEAWVYWEGGGRYPNIVTGGTWSPGGFLLFVSDEHCSFRMGRPGFSASGAKQPWRETSAPLLSPFAQGRWYHLAATFQRPEIKTYVNGQPVGSAAWDDPVGYQGDLVIGKWGGNVSHRGLIDEVKVFNRALGPDEIAASYRQGAAGRSPATEDRKAYEPIPRTSQLAAAAATFENESARLVVSPQGRCAALVDLASGEDRVLRTAPLVSVKIGDKVFGRAACSLEGGKLVFRFARAETTVVVGVDVKPRYFVFRIESVSNPEVDEVTFVHLALKPCDRVNAMSGLAAADRFGVCLRTLNLPTQVQVGRNPPVMTARAFREHKLEGAGAALVACPTPEVRTTLQEVVRNEGLPYSPLGGPFALDAERNRGTYVFASVSEENVERWIDLARRGGIDTIHLSGWEQSLGHYEPRENLFPRGLDGLKAVADKLHDAGLKVGIHTLTGCISPHDPWVRPVPDPRLATDGTFTLTADLGEQDADVPTAEAPGNFPTVWAYSSRGNCIRIGDELILYSALSNEPPYGFFECRRGAFGTKPAAHPKGAPVRHMYVRYGCFVPDEHSTLVDEVAERIAAVYNHCGLDQIYMDGAEAMRGWYGIARMRQAIFTRLERPALVEASCWDHHSWPFHSRIGAWDHPKWGLKRFADDHFRAIDQYRRAALLEAQLGWWVILGPDRDWRMEMPDEIEYLCAKALAHDAPLSFQSVAATGKPANARQNEYFTTIGRYERLRRSNYFSEAVKEKLREERQEFRLEQADDGQWQFLPTDYLEHKVTGLDDGTSTWTATNRFAAQPARLRIEALYSAYPYDDAKGVVLADFSGDDEFAPAEAAPRVRGAIRSADRPSAVAPKSACFTAANQGDSPVGAWARAVKTFDPVVNLTPHDAIGLWVHGDGKGGLLNVQLTNLPEYFRTLDDHHVQLDFEGWRYFELLLRERDAGAYHDYRWPYGAHCVLHRSPLVRHAVSKLTLYLNNIPPEEEVTCYVSPIRALRTRKVVLRNPAVEIGGKRLVFPVELESGMYVEFESADDCRLYDERGNLVRWITPEGEVPKVSPGDNRLAFTCEGPEGFRERAAVTLMTCGAPLRGRNPEGQIDATRLRRDDEPPRTIVAIDGRQNRWEIVSRAGEGADLEIGLRVDQVGSERAAYEAPSALTLESFDERGSGDDLPEPLATRYAYDAEPVAAGCSPGVTQQLTRSSDVVKLGTSSARYTATSTRDESGGWSVKGKRFAQPLDLSGFAAIGFWLYGDAGGQQFKLQLRDAAGGWQDMYTRVDFTGWRYCHFDLGASSLKDLSKIDGMNLYYNGIPAGKTVTCYVDDIRVMRAPEPLRDPTLTIAGRPIRFPVALGAGDELVFRPAEGCRLFRASGTVEPVAPEGAPGKLGPGRHPVVFSLPGGDTTEFRVVVSLAKSYP